MKKTIILTGALLCVVNMFAQVKKPVATVKKAPAKATATVNPFKGSTDSASYALGVRIAQNLKNSGFDKLNLSMVQKAMADVLQNKKILIEETALDACIGAYQQKASAEKASVAKQEGKTFLTTNGKRSGVVTLPSGLQYEIIKAGTGTAKPAPVSYTHLDVYKRQIQPKYGMLGTTFGGNQLACAAALAVLEVIQQDQLIDVAKQRGQYLLNRLKAIEGLQNVRGRGLMIGFDVPEALKDLKKKLLFDHNVFTGEAKPNVIRLLPSLAITRKQVDEFLDVLKEAIAEITAHATENA